MAVLCGVTAIAGHNWPVYLHFKGGKGVATGAGVIFALNWMAGLGALGGFLLAFALFRYVSLSSIVGSLTMMATQLLTGERIWGARVAPIHVFCVLVGLLVLVRHRANIVRLWKGEEQKVGSKKQDGD